MGSRIVVNYCAQPSRSHSGFSAQPHRQKNEGAILRTKVGRNGFNLNFFSSRKLDAAPAELYAMLHLHL